MYAMSIGSRFRKAFRREVPGKMSCTMVNVLLTILPGRVDLIPMPESMSESMPESMSGTIVYIETLILDLLPGQERIL